jgi:hypothetical protein
LPRPSAGFFYAPVIHLLVIHLPVIHLPVIHLLVIHLLVIHLLVIHLLVIHLLVIHLPVIHLLVIHLLVIHLLAIHPALNKASAAARPRDQICAARCAGRVSFGLLPLPLLFCAILWRWCAGRGSRGPEAN